MVHYYFFMDNTTSKTKASTKKVKEKQIETKTKNNNTKLQTKNEKRQDETRQNNKAKTKKQNNDIQKSKESNKTENEQQTKIKEKVKTQTKERAKEQTTEKEQNKDQEQTNEKSKMQTQTKTQKVIDDENEIRQTRLNDMINQTEKKKSTSLFKKSKPFSFVENPNKPKKHIKYIHSIVKLDKNDSLYTDEQFQKVRHISICGHIISSFRLIGVCLNKVDLDSLPKKPVKKVLFILINTNNDVGCFNDAYLLSMIHLKLGFKIVYLYNTNLITFLKFLGYFLKYTINSLTFYYTGHDSASKIRNIGHGIKFIDKSSISANELGQFIAEKSNGKTYILVLSDCKSGGSIFSMDAAVKCEHKSLSDIVSFTSHKSCLTPDQKIRSHGLFTYYFCKLIRQFPTISPEDMVDNLNEYTSRFRISYSYETSDVSGDRLSQDIIFEDADTALNGENAKITGPSKRSKVPEPKHVVEVEEIPIEFQGK